VLRPAGAAGETERSRPGGGGGGSIYLVDVICSIFEWVPQIVGGGEIPSVLGMASGF
jgi:hypothetical protein